MLEHDLGRGVSRGTFYNYFGTNADLLHAATEELGNEIVHLIETRSRHAFARRAACHGPAPSSARL